MANLDLLVIESGQQKRRPSQNQTIDFSAIRIGASNLQISETGGHFDVGAKKLTNLAEPTAASDAVTKAYADGIAAGLDIKQSVRVATIAALPANTPAGSGVGKTLTANANGALTVDGVSVVNGDRILVKNEAAGQHNGIYVVTAAGDGSNPFILTRASDADGNPAGEVTAGLFTFIEEGSIADQGWVLSTNNPITVDTTVLSFTQFSAAGAFTEGNGIDITSGIVSVDHDGQGLTFSGNQLALELDGSTLSKSASGVKVADSGITATQLATDAVETAKIQNAAVTEAKLAASVAGDGIAGGAGTALSVDHDGQGLQFVANQLALELDGSTLAKAAAGLKVADSGITATQLATDAVETAKIQNAAVTEAKLAASVAGDGIAGGAGTALSVDHDGQGLQFVANQLALELDGSTLAKGASGVKVADSGITATQLATDAVETAKIQNAAVTEAKLAASVAGAGLSGGAGSALAVNTGAAIKIASDAVAVDFAVSKTNDNAGAITVGQVVYVKADGDVDLAQATTTDLQNHELAIVEDASIAAAASGKVVVRRGAIIGGLTGLTPGQRYYVSKATAGAIDLYANISWAAGDKVYQVGRALSATELVFDPAFQFEY